MTPVDIGDTQGTLQARKTCITPYKRPETLIWVYTDTVPEVHLSKKQSYEPQVSDISESEDDDTAQFVRKSDIQVSAIDFNIYYGCFQWCTKTMLWLQEPK